MKIDKPTITDYTNATHNHSDNANGGTLTASSISDFDTEVSNNTDVAANTSARHNALTVTDSAEIDFTLTGQDLTASLKAGSIDETKLDTSTNASLDLADSAVQPAQIREKLTANRTYYVATTGSNSNTGLTAGSPFLTIQKAVDTVFSIDLSIYNVTIQLANGTYAENVSITAPFVGKGSVTISGDTTTPSNVHINSPVFCFNAENKARIFLKGMKISSGGNGILAQTGAFVRLDGNMEFGTCAGSHLNSLTTSIIENLAHSYSITGNANVHYSASDNAVIRMGNQTVTLTGTPAFSFFVLADRASEILAVNQTFSGTATGTRYVSAENSVVATVGGGATYFPGNVAGVTATGGIYT